MHNLLLTGFHALLLCQVFSLARLPYQRKISFGKADFGHDVHGLQITLTGLVSDFQN